MLFRHPQSRFRSVSIQARFTGTNNVGGLFGTANLKAVRKNIKNIENSYSTGEV